MTSTNQQPEKAAELRRLAEEVDQRDAELRRRAEDIFGERMAKRPEAREDISPEETRRLLHELQVHQIELEMQNEELRRAQEERERYLDLYDLAPVGYVTVSEQGLILKANLPAATLLGVERGTLITQPISRFIVKEDQDSYYLFWRQLLQNDGHQTLELRMVKTQKTVFWARLDTVVSSGDASIEPVCRIILTDITEHKLAEDQLRKYQDELEMQNQSLCQSQTELNAVQERYFNLYNEAPVGYCTLSKNGSVLEANYTATALLGFSQSALAGQPLTSFISTEDRNVFRLHLKRLLKAGIPQDLELQMVKKDETTFWVHLSVNKAYGSDGKPEIRIILDDISEKKQTEAELQQALVKSRDKANEVAALLKVARIILNNNDFKVVARQIFDTCRALVGATAGYVALLAKDGQENEVLFLEAGDLPCTVDPSLPMPVRGLREQAHRLLRVVSENDFPGSRWNALMPAGHVHLENVIFAPLVLEGMACGVMGLANKDGGFTENDEYQLGAFAELLTISLRNSHMLDALEEHRKRLQKSKASLEQRVQERTSDLAATTQQLMAEIEERKCIEKSLAIQRDLHSMLRESNEVLLLAKNREAIVQSVCKTAASSGHFPLAWVGFPDSNGNIQIDSSAGTAAHYLDRIEITTDGTHQSGWGPASTCLRTCRTSVNDDFATNPALAPWREHALAHGLHSSVALPVREGSRSIGAFSLYAALPGFFTNERVALLEQFAANLSSALGRLQVEEKQKQLIESLQLSEEKYRIVANNTYDWEFWIDPKGTFIYVSPACERISGHSPQEFKSNPELMKQILHPEDLPGYREHRHITSKKPSPQTLTFRIRRPDGHERWIEQACLPVFGRDGTFLGYRGCNRDCTERKAAEALIVQSEVRYRRITEAITDYIYTVQIENNVPVRTRHSPACQVVTGYSPDELAADPNLWLSMVEASHRETVLAFAQGLITNTSTSISIEHQIVRKDSAKRWVRNTLVPLRDAHGNLISYDGLIQDITELKKSESQILQSKKKLQAVFDGIPEPLVLIDEEKAIKMANLAAIRYFRLNSPQDIIGRSFCGENCTKREHCDRCPVPAAVVAGHKQVTFIRKGYMDSKRVESVSIFPIAAESKNATVIRISDITEAQMMQKSLLRTIHEWYRQYHLRAMRQFPQPT